MICWLQGSEFQNLKTSSSADLGSLCSRSIVLSSRLFSPLGKAHPFATFSLLQQRLKATIGVYAGSSLGARAHLELYKPHPCTGRCQDPGASDNGQSRHGDLLHRSKRVDVRQWGTSRITRFWLCVFLVSGFWCSLSYQASSRRRVALFESIMTAGFLAVAAGPSLAVDGGV